MIVKIAKPHIRKVNNSKAPWLCRGNGTYAHGDDPMHAYKRWRKLVRQDYPTYYQVSFA